jgi:hypothetical protein
MAKKNSDAKRKPERERAVSEPIDRDTSAPGLESGDWADEAAAARTQDDPRARSPHDRSGRPTTGTAPL